MSQHFIRVGRQAPLGRARVIYALPFNSHGNDVIPGAQLTRPHVVVDLRSEFPADPNNTMVGVPGVWVARMLTARWVEDTRRLAG
jgi:hypothetical protein